MKKRNQRKKVALLFYFLGLFFSPSNAQTCFKEISILSDTTLYYYSKNAIRYLNENCFFLKINDAQQVFEITFYPQKDKNITSVQLIPSSDMIVVDSLINIDNAYFKGKIKFKGPLIGNQKNILIAIHAEGQERKEEVKVFPYCEPQLLPTDKAVDMYAGEEKTIELPVTNPDNIKIPTSSVRTIDYDYSISMQDKTLKIQIHPYTTGNKELTLNLKTCTPFLNSSNQLAYILDPCVLHFTVRPSRLNFANTDKNDFFFDARMDDSEEIQLDQKRGLEPGKIYRVENQLESGGKLIAELYTKSIIGDNKVLCSLHPYSYHSISEGYLYIKQGNEAKCITNFNVMQKPVIEGIWLLHDGEDWSTLPVVYPGENVQIRVEGKGLAKAKLQFTNAVNVKQDSTRVFDDVIFYSFTVPFTINAKVIYMEMNQKKTKYELKIKENRHPRDLDFVFINYGFQTIALTSATANKPIVDPHPLNEINISFDFSSIDQQEDLYGKQYLDFEFKVYNSRNDLIEDQKLENIVVCPDESSLRSSFYDRKDCFKSIINVNDYLLHKTYDLEGWSKVEIIVKHAAKNYSEPGYTRRVIIIKERLTSVDLQASFPAGLLINKYRNKGIGELSGLSIGFLAQMSFYEKDAIEKIKPYKIGAGFMVLNIFNLESAAAQPDIAAVVIGSVFPLKPERKFNFPLYFGGGYMLRSGNWFTLLGPGVQFNF